MLSHYSFTTFSIFTFHFLCPLSHSTSPSNFSLCYLIILSPLFLYLCTSFSLFNFLIRLFFLFATFALSFAFHSHSTHSIISVLLLSTFLLYLQTTQMLLNRYQSGENQFYPQLSISYFPTLLSLCYHSITFSFFYFKFLIIFSPTYSPYVIFPLLLLFSHFTFLT